MYGPLQYDYQTLGKPALKKARLVEALICCIAGSWGWRVGIGEFGGGMAGDGVWSRPGRLTLLLVVG